MTIAAIEQATLFLPIFASSAIFALRRANKGLNAMEQDPLYGSANVFIAGGQTLKGARAAKDLTIESGNMSAAESIKKMDKTVKVAAKSSKFLNVAGKVFDFISRNVNPLIVVAETIKVLNSEDIVDAAVRSFMALGFMFAGEAFAKRYIGMSYQTIENGKRVTKQHKALYHENPFVEKQVNAMKDYCKTKELFNKCSLLKATPGILKGLLFVGASIGSYAIGKKFATCLIGEEKTTQNQGKQTVMQLNFNNAYMPSASVKAA